MMAGREAEREVCELSEVENVSRTIWPADCLGVGRPDCALVCRAIRRRVMTFRKMNAVFMLGTAILLVACSGGNGGGSGGTPPAASVRISGTAAAGAPVVGFVAVRDSSANPQPVRTNIPIEANGHYSVDVTGLRPPFAFQAVGTVGGRTVSLYSAATLADVGGTINITPFTDLIIRNIAASAVDTYINNGGFTGLTPAQLNDQRVTLTNQLAPALTAMGLSGSIDLLRATFNADHTGLDRFMDVVKVSTTPTTATITNIYDAANALIIDTTTGAPASPPLGTGGLAASGTPADLILQAFNNWSSLFATQLPNPADPNVLALFSDVFLDGGDSRSAFLTDLTTQVNLVGLTFSNFVLDSLDATGEIAQVHITPRNAAGELLVHDQPDGSIVWQVRTNSSGVWQVAGDQRIADINVKTVVSRNICNAGSPTNCVPGPTYESGLNLQINNNGLRPIGSAVVTGPGLPAGGVTLVAQANQIWFGIPNSPCPGCFTNNYRMTDGEIAMVLPNSSYTVQLFSNDVVPALMATYTEVVPVAPALNTALPVLAYPSISGMQNLAGISNATLIPSWTIPAELWGDTISVNVYQSSPTPGSGPSLNVWADLFGHTGTSTLVVTAPLTGSWTSGNYWISAWDQYGGRVTTNYQ